MNDLVLRTRLAVLKRNLEQVGSIANLVQKARSGAGLLRQLLSEGDTSVQARINKIQLQIDISLTYLDAAARRSESRSVLNEVDQARSFLNQAKHEAQDIVLNQFKEVHKILESTRTRAVQICEDRLGETLKREIWEQATDCVDGIDTIEKSMGNAAAAEKKGDKSSAQKLMKEAWVRYNCDVFKKSRPVFADSVDFLEGLALRDTGFDEEVCEMADALIAKVERVCGFRGGSLTIPAHHEADSTTFARSLIRLGYPEWTLWALPLTAHEFGHVVVAQKPKLQDFVKEKGANERAQYYLEDLLADCFATYVMGPAYACSAILLRLNLLSAYEDREEQPAAAKRAHVMFSMLRRIDAQDVNKPYDGIIEALYAGWVAALEQTVQIGVLNQETKDQLDQCVEIMGELLDKSRLVDPPKWAITQGWPAKLLQSNGKDISVEGTEELREVLNAAWVCRLTAEVPLENIREAADALWKRILEKRNEESPNGMGGERR